MRICVHVTWIIFEKRHQFIGKRRHPRTKHTHTHTDTTPPIPPNPKSPSELHLYPPPHDYSLTSPRNSSIQQQLSVCRNSVVYYIVCIHIAYIIYIVLLVYIVCGDDTRFRCQYFTISITNVRVFGGRLYAFTNILKNIASG